MQLIVLSDRPVEDSPEKDLLSLTVIDVSGTVSGSPLPKSIVSQTSGVSRAKFRVRINQSVSFPVMYLALRLQHNSIITAIRA